MSVLVSGLPCVDPLQLSRSCLASGIPTERWQGKANSFSIPLGRGAGRGHVLLRKAELDALTLTADLTLTFQGADAAHTLTFQKVTLLGRECVTPGYSLDPDATYLCECVDRRYHLRRVPVDKAYNVRSADGTTTLSGTLNAGSPWTWQGVVTNLAATLGIGALALPFAPDGAPANLTYFAPWNAWDALCDVLDRLACAVEYDPVTNTFSVVRLGSADATWAASAAALDGERLWDGYCDEEVRGWRPETVRVLFPRRPQPSGGTSPYHAEDVPLDAAAGVEPGTSVQLFDDLAALGATGAPSNAAALATRAAERAADWLRRQEFEAPLVREYRDFVYGGGPAALLGSLVGEVEYRDDGGLMRTAVRAGQGGVLEAWRPLAEWPGGSDHPAPIDAGETTAPTGAWAGGIDTTTCLKLDVLTATGACSDVPTWQVLYLAWDAVTESWVSDGDFTYDGGTGPVGFWLAEGRGRLAIDNVELLGLGGGAGAEGLLFAGGGSGFCAAATELCRNVFVVRVACAACPEATGTFDGDLSPQFQLVPPGETVRVPVPVDGLDNPIPPSQVYIDVDVPGGLDTVEFVLIAPDGTQYQLIDQPAGAGDVVQLQVLLRGDAAPSGQIQLQTGPGAPLLGQFQTPDDFEGFAGNPNGQWQLQVVNGGALPVVINQFQIAFGAFGDPGAFVDLNAGADGAAPLQFQIDPDLDFAPLQFMVDWGDGGDPEWFLPSQAPFAHEYTVPGAYPLTVRAYTAQGVYEEDTSHTVTVTPGSTCATATAAALPLSYSGSVAASGEEWWTFTMAPSSGGTLTLSGVTGADVSAQAFDGSCGSLNPLHPLQTGDGTRMFATVAGGQHWVQVTNNTAAPAPYTLDVTSP